jgi:hypothetical protein
LFPVYVTFETTISYQTFAIGGSGDTDFGCWVLNDVCWTDRARLKHLGIHMVVHDARSVLMLTSQNAEYKKDIMVMRWGRVEREQRWWHWGLVSTCKLMRSCRFCCFYDDQCTHTSMLSYLQFQPGAGMYGTA